MGCNFFSVITGSWVEVRLSGRRRVRHVIPDDSTFRSEFQPLQNTMLKNETAAPLIYLGETSLSVPAVQISEKLVED